MPAPPGTVDFDVGASALATLTPRGIERADSFGSDWRVVWPSQVDRVSVDHGDIIWALQVRWDDDSFEIVLFSPPCNECIL